MRGKEFWDEENLVLDESSLSGGYPILCLTKTDEEGKLEVGVVCKTKTDDWSVPYEAYEGLIPAYKDGDKLMVFAWQF